jgi:hypothetical protein
MTSEKSKVAASTSNPERFSVKLDELDLASSW